MKAKETASKTTAQILRDNVCTLFNLLNLLIAIALIAVHAWSNLFFIFVIALNTVIGIAQELKAKRLIEKLTLLSQPNAKIERNGTIQSVPIAEVQEQDILLLESGNQICADAIVRSGGIEVNESLLTGESDAIFKKAGDTLLSGSSVISGTCQATVLHVGSDSYAAKLTKEAKKTKAMHSELVGSMRKVTRLTSLCIVPLGILLFVQALFFRDSSMYDAVVGTSAGLLGMLPKGLYLLISISLAAGIITLSKKNVLVQDLYSLENLAHVDVLCLDKTGTLTKAQPTVVDVISFNGQSSDELLRIAACLEEHFPHSMAKAVVNKAIERNLVHEELHSKVEYIVAHGIYSTLEGRKIIIGSHHFVFEDENAKVPEDKKQLFEELPEQYSHLYMAIDGLLAAVICIEDPLRKEAPEVIRRLKKYGISKVVMMTGDSDRIASTIADKVGVDEYYSEVLPEDKAKFVENEKNAGRKVIMIGDGINDSPALSEANVGIAISDGAEIAREIADVTISADNLYEIATLKQLSDAMVRRINTNYRLIVGINTGLIVLGIAGVFQPTMSALFHNTSTILISLKSMNNLLDQEPVEEIK